MDLTEEEADDILNKDDFLSNTSNDFDPLKKKSNGSMMDFEEISRNLLNSDYEPNHILNSLDHSNQLSDKELDHLLSSGFNTGNDSIFKVSEKIERSSEPNGQKVTLNPLDKISKICEGSGSNLNSDGLIQNNTLTSEIQEGSEIRHKIDRVSSIGSSLIKGNNTSDLKVLTSEIGDFDTGNFGAIDTVINSQEVIQSKGDLNDFGDCIPEAESEEDSDEGDFIDRRSRVEKVKTISKEEDKEEVLDKKKDDSKQELKDEESKSESK